MRVSEWRLRSIHLSFIICRKSSRRRFHLPLRNSAGRSPSNGQPHRSHALAELLYFLDVVWLPRLMEEGFRRPVEAQQKSEPAVAPKYWRSSSFRHRRVRGRSRYRSNHRSSEPVCPSCSATETVGRCRGPSLRQKPGYADVESKQRFPHPRSLDYDGCEIISQQNGETPVING
jgi:hypothetical protein